VIFNPSFEIDQTPKVHRELELNQEDQKLLESVQESLEGPFQQFNLLPAIEFFQNEIERTREELLFVQTKVKEHLGTFFERIL
jgi:hypothetical protein